MADACCPPAAAPGGADSQQETELLDAEDLLSDPTMSSCCIREMKDRRRAEALRQKLSAVDISMQRRRAAASVLRTPPDIPQQHLGSDQGSDWEGRPDSELEGLRAQRMQELIAQARDHASQQARGLGQLNDVSENNLLVRVNVEYHKSPVLQRCVKVADRPCCQLSSTARHAALVSKGQLDPP